MDLFHEKLDHIFLEENEKNALFTVPSGPLVLTGNLLPFGRCRYKPNGSLGFTPNQLDEEDIIIGLYTKDEIRERMRSELE